MLTQQCTLMRFDPVSGGDKPYPSNAAQYREYHGEVAFLFNPWTGHGRHPLDIGTDPLGKLIIPEGERILSACN